MDQIGSTFTILESVDSTNNYAMAQVHAGLAKHGEAYLALEQTHGKGQRGNAWKSGNAENIALTCILQPVQLIQENPFMLSVVIALSCYDFVNHYTKSETAIKWPNDIYWRDRKAAGILIENNFQGMHWQYAVVGIGLNINQTLFSPDLPNPVSLKQVTGKTFDIIWLARKLCDQIQHRMELLKSCTCENLLMEYNSLLYKKDRWVFLKNNDSIFKTVIKGVSKNGQLITCNGEEKTFNWGEVEWIN